MPTIDEIKDLLERVRQKHLLMSREDTKEVTRPSPASTYESILMHPKCRQSEHHKSNTRRKDRKENHPIKRINRRGTF